jgi:hypothetical protein
MLSQSSGSENKQSKRPAEAAATWPLSELHDVADQKTAFFMVIMPIIYADGNILTLFPVQ